MYNYNFISRDDEFISEEKKTRERSINNEIIDDKRPNPTTYADTSIFSRRIMSRRPNGIGKILKKSLIK